jgi:hypothetical protein
MPGKSSNFLHFGILPDVNLIVRIAVSAYHFIESFAEHQVAHLGTNI